MQKETPRRSGRKRRRRERGGEEVRGGGRGGGGRKIRRERGQRGGKKDLGLSKLLWVAIAAVTGRGAALRGRQVNSLYVTLQMQPELLVPV